MLATPYPAYKGQGVRNLSLHQPPRRPLPARRRISCKHKTLGQHLASSRPFSRPSPSFDICHHSPLLPSPSLPRRPKPSSGYQTFSRAAVFLSPTERSCPEARAGHPLRRPSETRNHSFQFQAPAANGRISGAGHAGSETSFLLGNPAFSKLAPTRLLAQQHTRRELLFRPRCQNEERTQTSTGLAASPLQAQIEKNSRHGTCWHVKQSEVLYEPSASTTYKAVLLPPLVRLMEHNPRKLQTRPAPIIVSGV